MGNIVESTNMEFAEETFPDEVAGDDFSMEEDCFTDYGGLPLQDFSKQMLTDIWKYLNGVELLKLQLVSQNWNQWVDSLDDKWWQRLFEEYQESLPQTPRQLFYSVFEVSTNRALLSYAPTFRQRYRILLTTVVVGKILDPSETAEFDSQIPNPRVRRIRYFTSLMNAMGSAYPGDVLFLRRGSHPIAKDYVWAKPLVIIGEENDKHLISTFIDGCPKFSVVGKLDPNATFSMYSLCCDDVHVSNAILKVNRCVTSTISVGAGGNAQVTACLIRGTRVPFILEPNWASLSVALNTLYRPQEEPPEAPGLDAPRQPPWGPTLTDLLLKKLEANRFDWEIQTATVKTFLFISRSLPNDLELPQVITGKVLPLLWNDFKAKRITTAKAFEPLDILLEQGKAPNMEEAIRTLGLQDIIPSLFEARTLQDDPLILKAFCVLLRRLNLWETNQRANVLFFFDSLVKWMDYPDILIELLTTLWNFLFNLKEDTRLVLTEGKLPVLLKILRTYRDTNKAVLERCCGVLWNLPKQDPNWDDEQRKEMFEEIMYASKATVTAPCASIVGLINHCFFHPSMRQMFVAHDGVSLLFEILEAKPFKTVEKRVLTLIDSLLHHDDTVSQLYSTISLLKKSTFLQWNRSAIFGTLACYAKKNPAVVPDVLVQLRAYMSEGVTWTSKDIWRMIDALGTIAMFQGNQHTCQDIMDQMRLVISTIELEDISRINKWLKWVQFCINSKQEEIPSVPYCTAQVAVYLDGLTLRSMSGGFASAAFGVCVHSGKWYYEVRVLTDDIFQIGWVTNVEAFAWNGVDGVGVGDDAFSWGVDFNRLLLWNGPSTPYGKIKWKPNDVVGCFLDIDAKVMSFSLNGVDYGAVSHGFGMIGGMNPGLSMSGKQECTFNFGATPFAYPHFDYLPLHLATV